MGVVTFTKIDYFKENAEWLRFRNRGVGASDVPAILGYDEYKCNLELFYEKIGMPTYSIDSLPMIVGNESQDMIVKLYQHWGGDEKSLVMNYRAGHIVRHVEDIKAYACNSDMPMLFASVDGKILPYGSFSTPGCLECKNTQRHIVERYDNKVVPAHLIQNLTQIFTTDWGWGEVAYYFDNKKFDVVPLHDVTPYSELIEHMKSEIRLFWSCVEKGRKLWTERVDAEYNMKQRRMMEIDNEISLIEPPRQDTPVYLAYLSEKFKNRKAGINVIKGNTELYNAAKLHKDIKMQIEELRSKLLVEEITLKTALGTNSKMEFGQGMGYVSWATSVNGSRPFLNKAI